MQYIIPTQRELKALNNIREHKKFTMGAKTMRTLMTLKLINFEVPPNAFIVVKVHVSLTRFGKMVLNNFKKKL